MQVEYWIESCDVDDSHVTPGITSNRYVDIVMDGFKAVGITAGSRWFERCIREGGVI
jgi:hypothetical protein